MFEPDDAPRSVRRAAPALAARAAALALLAVCAGWAGCSKGGPAGTTTGGSPIVDCPGATLCVSVCADVQSDPKNCGSCGTACAAGEVCSAGACALECVGGTTNCGAACVATASDPKNCGSCGTACAAGEVCSAGVCALACVGGTTKCGAACVETANDPKNCGTCGTQCPADQICAAGTCALECPGGTTKCGDACKDVADDPANCGACGTVCPGPMNAAATCVKSACAYVCGPPNADCNGVAGDGCEVDLLTDPLHCGSCTTPCPALANAASVCASGQCGLGACTTGFSDCNQNPSDGCEIDTLADSENCGSCGMACAAAQTCTAGACTDLLWTPGVQQNVDPSTLVGWTKCFTGDYATSYDLTTVLGTCSAAKLLLACKQSSSADYALAAMAPRADVLFECGSTVNCTQQANGVGWYFDANFSWGFAPAGDDVDRDKCDYNAGAQQDAGLRMCWPTSGGSVTAGTRCGDNVVNDATWVRDIWQAN